MSDGKFDPHRRLCPDGACIGVIGDDGRCRVCGRSASGAPAAAGFVAAGNEPDDDDDEGDGAAERDGDGDAEAKRASPGGFDPNRRLCPDGSCIGVIGAGGVCTVCGQKGD
jgi:hypothetical protein